MRRRPTTDTIVSLLDKIKKPLFFTVKKTLGSPAKQYQRQGELARIQTSQKVAAFVHRQDASRSPFWIQTLGMPSLQDLLVRDCDRERDPPPSSASGHPQIDDAAVRAVVSILSAHAGRFLRDAALRRRLREKCSALCCLKSSAHSVIANLELGIESIERMVEGGGSKGELKIISLRNAIRLLSVAADVNSGRRSRGGGGGGGGEFTGGVANSHLSACSHLYLSIVYKIERKDRASARHLLQVFWDAPYLARRSLLPDLWEQLFLPHLLHIKVWYAKEVKFISGWDGKFREQRMKRLERAYNDQMDVGTSRFARYYKEWVKLGGEAPSIPSVTLPSVAVSRNMYNSVVSISLEREGTADNKLLKKKVEAIGGTSEAGLPLNSDLGLQQRQPNSIQQHLFVRPFVTPEPASAPAPCRSYSLQFSCSSNSVRLSCSSNSLRLLSCHSILDIDPNIHPQIPKNESFNDTPILNFDRAISLISNSDSLPECEMAVHVIAKAWLDSHGESVTKTILSTSSFIGGLLEVSSTSKDDDVLELAICILAELVMGSEVNRQVVLNADPQLEILLRLSEKSSLLLKAAVLAYLLKPKAKQMLSPDWIPLILRVLDLADEAQTLFTVRCCPKSAAIYLLDQLIMGFDVDRNMANARQMVALGGLSLLIKRLEMGSEQEKETCASLLATCIRADGSCRDYLVSNIKKVSIIQLFLGNQLKSDGNAISLLSELVCLSRITRVIEFLNGLKNDGCLNTMHVLLVYLQQAPHEHRPLAAVLLLLLDLLGSSNSCSFYGQEGIDALVAALERSLHNTKVQDQCTRALLLLGGRFSSAGEALSEAWLLKRAGIHDGQEELLRSKERNGDEFEGMEEEEKAAEDWLRKLAIVLLTSGNKRLLVALSNCIADGIPGLARSCLVTVTWMSCSLSSLHNSKRNHLVLACSILTPRLLETLSYDKTMVERVLASLSLLSFSRHRECLQMLIPLSKETIASLEDLSRLTWTADELLFMCSLWSNTLNQAPKHAFDNDTD